LRLLLDTHAFLWWLDGDPLLSAAARAAVGDEANLVYVSAASAWEIATKHRLGKLPGASAVAADITACVEGQGFAELPISLRHGDRAGALPGPHRDPFDRVLIAQALIEDLALVSNESAFDAYGARRLW
jgi:PIN domain nuclease of toxin-antitoxin system